MKLLPFILISLISCGKDYIQSPSCQRVYYLSDKYTADMVYIKTDSLWPWGRYHNDFCGAELEVFRNKRDSFIACTDRTYEVRRYVVGNVITYAKIYK